MVHVKKVRQSPVITLAIKTESGPMNDRLVNQYLIEIDFHYLIVVKNMMVMLLSAFFRAIRVGFVYLGWSLVISINGLIDSLKLTIKITLIILKAIWGVK